MLLNLDFDKLSYIDRTLPSPLLVMTHGKSLNCTEVKSEEAKNVLHFNYS